MTWGRGAACLVALAGSAAAQLVVNPGRLRARIEIFEPKPGENLLHCEVTPVHPMLNFSFRYQAGYRVAMPASQFTGSGHRLIVLIRITPDQADAAPVYLAAMQRLPEIPDTHAQLRFGGGYLLGEGSYHVDWVLMDERDRVFRKSWRVDVHRSHAEHNVKVAMEPGTVLDVTLRGARLVARESDDTAALRLTILLHAAPIFPRRTHLGGNDIGTLISAVASLVESMRVRQIRLIVFNLEQQKELYRNEDFMLAAMPAVARSMNTVELDTVDYQVLKNRGGHVDLLTGLLNEELNREPRSDVVLFLGPASHFDDRIPADVLGKASGGTTRFFNFQIRPYMLAQAAPSDVIRNVTARLGGKTIQIHTAGEFATALDRLK